jgi:hypothetical protein
MKPLGFNAGLGHLNEINHLADEWHGEYCRLGGREISGDRRLIRRIQQLEEMLEEFWDRRRRLLALACARAMPAELLVQRFERDFLGDRIHVAPLC